MDVKVVFDENLARGCSVADATQHVLKEPPWGFDDEEDAAAMILALASLQLEHNALDQAVRERAIAVIDSGVPLWGWEDLPDERLAERTAVLHKLKQQLLGVSS